MSEAFLNHYPSHFIFFPKRGYDSVHGQCVCCKSLVDYLAQTKKNARHTEEITIQYNAERVMDGWMDRES